MKVTKTDTIVNLSIAFIFSGYGKFNKTFFEELMFWFERVFFSNTPYVGNFSLYQILVGGHNELWKYAIQIQALLVTYRLARKDRRGLSGWSVNFRD